MAYESIFDAPAKGQPAPPAHLDPVTGRNVLANGTGPLFLSEIAGETFAGKISPTAFNQFVRQTVTGDDPFERMFQEQMLWMHHRIGSLLSAATRAEDVTVIERLTAAAARLQGEFRRSMLALAEIRSPGTPRQVVVQQQNIATGGEQRVAYLQGGMGAKQKVPDSQLVSNTPPRDLFDECLDDYPWPPEPSARRRRSQESPTPRPG